MTRFTLSPDAERDLMEIWLYTADSWGVDQADRYVLGIKNDLPEQSPGHRWSALSTGFGG